MLLGVFKYLIKQILLTKFIKMYFEAKHVFYIYNCTINNSQLN